MDGGGRFAGSVDGARAVVGLARQAAAKGWDDAAEAIRRFRTAGERLPQLRAPFMPPTGRVVSPRIGPAIARGKSLVARLLRLLPPRSAPKQLSLPLEPIKPRRAARALGGSTGRLQRRGLGATLAFGFLAATGLYGAERGGHWSALQAALASLPDQTANAFGFRIASITIEGQAGLGDEEVVEALGVTDQHSLPFLDVRAARDRLLRNPLVADATVRKLYPDRLVVSLVEREAFALWQVGGAVSIISDDGTVLDELRDRRFADLPLVVGPGAAREARRFLALLEPHPDLRERMYAGVFVAERRWNLRLRNGVDVLLPETGAEAALVQLDRLLARRDVLDRDITAVDLRLPERVVVRLTEEAAETLAKAEKAKKPKKGAT